MHDRQSTKFYKYPSYTNELPASSKLRSLKRNLLTLYSITKTCSTSLEEFKLKRRLKLMLKKNQRNKRQSCSNNKKDLPKCRSSNRQHTSHHRATWINIRIQACLTTNTRSTCSIWLLKSKMILPHSRQPLSNTRVVQVNLTAMMKRKALQVHLGQVECQAVIMKTHISQESTKTT